MAHYTGHLVFHSETGTEGGYWAFQDREYIDDDGMESRYGLHVLKTGDTLVVYDKIVPERVVWQGDIDLKQLGLFTDDAFGMWIHADQRGVERETWATMFLREWPAELTTETE